MIVKGGVRREAGRESDGKGNLTVRWLMELGLRPVDRRDPEEVIAEKTDQSSCSVSQT